MQFARDKQNKRVILSVGAIVAAVAIAAGVFWVQQLSKPAYAPVIVTAGNTAVPAPPQPVPVSDAYARFSYPGAMSPEANVSAPAGYEVAVYNYAMSDTVPWHLAIDINHLQEPDLTFDSSYLARKDHPAEYQASTVTAGGNTFTVMTDTQAGNFSKVAFALHGDLSVDISLTGDDTSGGTTVAAAFQQVLQSWRWE